MRRHKRDRVDRAWNKGYQAGIQGRSRDLCPFGNLQARSSWLNGWREGRTDNLQGFTGVASVQNMIRNTG